MVGIQNEGLNIANVTGYAIIVFVFAALFVCGCRSIGFRWTVCIYAGAGAGYALLAFAVHLINL